MSVTQQQIDSLQAQINDISHGLANSITATELTAAVELLERDFAVVKSISDTLDPRVTRIQQQANAITSRFKRYASNEKQINDAAEVLPTLEEKAALEGTVGIPGISNEYVTSQDPRLSDDRNALAHSLSHTSGEHDSISHDQLDGAGSITHAEIEHELEIIKAYDDTQDERLDSLESDLEAESLALSSFTADSLPDGTVKRVTTLEEISRILPAAIYNALVDLGVGTTASLLSVASGDLRYQLKASNTETYMTQNMLEALTIRMRPDEDNLIDLGAANRAFRKIYAYEFIDVDGSSFVIKDKHLGYNGEDYLNFGGDRVILQSYLKPLLTQQENFNTMVGGKFRDVDNDLENTNASIVNVHNKISTFIDQHSHKGFYTRSTLQDMTKDASGIFQSFLHENNVEGLVKEDDGKYAFSWSALRDVPTALDVLPKLAKFKGFFSSIAELPTDNLAAGDYYFTTRGDVEGLMGLYVVANPNAKSFSTIYRPAFTQKSVSHAQIKDTEALDAHPQYMLKSDADSIILHNLDAIKTAVGIGTVGSLFTAENRQDLVAACNHTTLVSNPHKVTAASIGALKNEDGVIELRHLPADYSADDILEGKTQRFVTDSLIKKIAFIEDNIVEHKADNDKHWNSTMYSALFSKDDTDAHFHSKDRDLANSTGVLPQDNMCWDSVYTFVRNADFLSNVFENMHPESHMVEEHSDCDVSGDQLTALQKEHARLRSAHNVDFGGTEGEYGTSGKVSRLDHHHDRRYISIFSILSERKDSDPVGTIRVDEDFVYIKLNSGWKKSDLTPC